MSVFKKAQRNLTKLKIGVSGPSGSGKTMGALTLAASLGKRIAVGDTENDSASLYADKFDFDTLSIRPPYTVDKYAHVIAAAEAAGYDVLVLDSVSHEWAGDGGLLSVKEGLDSRPGSNHFSNWAPVSKEHERFKSLILNCKIHLICTMRSKQDYVLVENERGKQVPQKVGLAPVQREGFEFEMTVVFDLDMTHQVTVSKDRTSLFDGKRFKITPQTGDELVAWLKDAKPAVDEPPQDAAPPPPASVPPTDRSGVACSLCQAELRMHGAKSGYICPNAKVKDDGHTRVIVSALERARQAQPYKAQAS